MTYLLELKSDTPMTNISHVNYAIYGKQFPDNSFVIG